LALVRSTERERERVLEIIGFLGVGEGFAEAGV
jgi:hypothetical protein